MRLARFLRGEVCEWKGEAKRINSVGQGVKMEFPKSVVSTLAKAGASIGAPGIVLIAGLIGIMAFDLLSTTPARAQAATMGCGLRSDIAAELKQTHEENPIALGVTSVGTVMELWTARDGETWTLLVTLPDGSSCVVGAGQDWMAVQRAAKGKLS